MDIWFSTAEVTWDNASIPMQPTNKFAPEFVDKFEQELLFAHHPVSTDAERIQNIVENKYCPADVRKISDECTLRDTSEKEQLFSLLSKYEHLFDGTLGSWNTEPIELELKEADTKPYHAKPYPVPRSQEKLRREEIARLISFVVLRKVNRSEWACPMFTIDQLDRSDPSGFLIVNMGQAHSDLLTFLNTPKEISLAISSFSCFSCECGT